jgi:cysteine synthase
MVPIMFWRLFAPANTQAIKILEPFSPSTRLSEQHPTRSPRGYDRINPPFGDITMARFDNILGTIGRTPVVRINKLGPTKVALYAKVESFNPMGSVKDRLALGVIEDAERKGLLSPGQTVIEATSGNTGIGLAMVCAQKGYPLVVTMAENFSIERRKMMRFLGARVVLTPAAQKGSGMLAKACELAEKHGWYLCRQFENEANADVHSQTTAQEILQDFADEKLDYFVTGFGTGGTLKGISRVLKDKMPETQIVVCEPDNSPLIASGMPQPATDDGSPAGSHPGFRPHLMQGWTPDFISKLAGDAMVHKLIDEIVHIKGDDALRLSRELATREGIFTGISAGATLAGALQIAQKAPEGSTILCMLPDTGERYLSTQLFDGIEARMSDEELEISRSTTGARFDVQAAPPSKPEEASAPRVPVTAATREFTADLINEAAKPVVLFALEWCEFCWSVRKFFDKCGIPFRSVDLDSAEYQQDGRGGQIRAVLTEKTGSLTIPQIFIGGKFVGGCTELFDAYKQGELQNVLRETGVGFDKQVDIDPYSLLPTWLQPR